MKNAKISFLKSVLLLFNVPYFHDYVIHNVIKFLQCKLNMTVKYQYFMYGLPQITNVEF